MKDRSDGSFSMAVGQLNSIWMSKVSRWRLRSRRKLYRSSPRLSNRNTWLASSLQCIRGGFSSWPARAGRSSPAVPPGFFWRMGLGASALGKPRDLPLAFGGTSPGCLQPSVPCRLAGSGKECPPTLCRPVLDRSAGWGFDGPREPAFVPPGGPALPGTLV
jgi:hypothetical protein